MARVSVIVPVRERRQLLMQLLDALDAQTYSDFEVVVVDDGSTDGSGDAAGARAVRGRPVRVVRAGGGGAVEARRLGANAASGEILAFTDSDCVPEPQWLQAAVAALDAGAGIVHGPTRPSRAARPLERTVASGGDGLYPSCNVIYRRSAFDAAGGFDPAAAERLGFRLDGRARRLGFGEDTLLAWRVRRAAGATYVEDAVVRHHVFPGDLVDSLSRALMAGAFPALVREVPELRDSLLDHRVVLGSPRRLLVYALAAALCLRRRRLRQLAVAATLAAWVAVRRREQGGLAGSGREKLAALPVELAGDVVTTAALAAGSVRARTVVL